MAYRGAGAVGSGGFSLASVGGGRTSGAAATASAASTTSGSTAAAGAIGSGPSASSTNNTSALLSAFNAATSGAPGLGRANATSSTSNNTGSGAAAGAAGLGSNSTQAQAAFLNAGPNRTISNVGAQSGITQGSSSLSGTAASGAVGLAGFGSPNVTNAPGLSDLNLDPSDFPALGGSGSSSSLLGGHSGLLSSYATQASAATGAGLGRDSMSFFTGNLAPGSGGPTASLLNPQPREFREDDFPALGAHADHSSQGQFAMNGMTNGQSTALHQQQRHQQAQQQNSEQASAAAALAHRQSLLGNMPSPAQNPSRLLSSAATSAMYGSEDALSQKRNYANKLSSHQGPSSLSPFAANAPLPPLSSNQRQQSSPLAGHALPNGISQALDGSSNSISASASPAALQRLPQPIMSNLPPQLSQMLLQQHMASQRQAQQSLNSHQAVQIPQTPAQQVLYSPADRFGLLGLLNIIKLSADPDFSLLTLGTDLEKLGLDLASTNNLHSTFITPWADAEQVAQMNLEPEFSLPTCYNVAPPPASSKVAAFSDETLFFVFYSQPRDAMQEAAAEQLYKRNWRYHKDLHLWLTKEAGSEPTQKTATYERGSYIFFDPNTWERVQKEFVLVFEHLETRHRGSGAAIQQPTTTIQQPTPQLQQGQQGPVQQPLSGQLAPQQQPVQQSQYLQA